MHVFFVTWRRRIILGRPRGATTTGVIAAARRRRSGVDDEERSGALSRYVHGCGGEDGQQRVPEQGTAKVVALATTSVEIFFITLFFRPSSRAHLGLPLQQHFVVCTFLLFFCSSLTSAPSPAPHFHPTSTGEGKVGPRCKGQKHNRVSGALFVVYI